MDAAQAQRGAIRVRLRELTKSVRTEKQRARRTNGHVHRIWQLSSRDVRVALATYMLSGHEIVLCEQFLRRVGQRRQWPSLATIDAIALVKDLFLQHDADMLPQLIDTNAPLDALALRVAQKLVAEWQVVLWGEELNRAHGIAVSTKAILEKASTVGCNLPASALGRMGTGRPDKRARQ